MITTASKRNISIELLRVVACFLVIMAHIQLKPVISDGIFSWKRICFSSLIGDNVPIFFLITGFYMFQTVNCEKDIFQQYKGKVIIFLQKIWFPSLLVVIITCVANSWLHGNEFGQDIQWNWLHNFVFRISANGTCGHLWYICTYVRFIAFFPIMAFICQNRPAHNKIRRVYLLLSLFHIFLSDVEYLIQKDFFDFSKIVFDYYFLYLLIGNEIGILFRSKKLSESKLSFGIGITLYVLGNFLRIILQNYAFEHWGTNIKSYFMGLECFPTYISSCGIFLLFYSLKTIKWKLTQVWIFLGKYSFYIYLFHFVVIRKLQSLQLQSHILDIHDGGTTFIHIALYYLELGGIVFGISFLLGIVFEKIYTFLLRTLRRVMCRLFE